MPTPDESRNLQIAPEILLKTTETPNEKSDAWSVTATLLELILEERTWIVDEFSIPMAQAMELKLEPTILQYLMGANQLLHFLREALKYEPSERLSVMALLRGMQNLLLHTGNILYLYFQEEHACLLHFLKLPTLAVKKSEHLDL